MHFQILTRRVRTIEKANVEENEVLSYPAKLEEVFDSLINGLLSETCPLKLQKAETL